MRRILLLTLLGLSVAGQAAEGQQLRWSKTLERIASGVVSIRVDGTRAFDTEWNQSTQATGFVVELGIPSRAHAPGWIMRPWISPFSLLLALGVVFGILRHRSDDEGGTTAQRR